MIPIGPQKTENPGRVPIDSYEYDHCGQAARMPPVRPSENHRVSTGGRVGGLSAGVFSGRKRDEAAIEFDNVELLLNRSRRHAIRAILCNARALGLRSGNC